MRGTVHTREDSHSISIGSSPRMRGTAVSRDDHEVARRGRFIPAHAGNSSAHFYRLESIPAHAGNSCQTGSSPRMRGTEGTMTSRRPCQLPVHPRACGEQGNCGSSGSAGSPRMRGTGFAAGHDRTVGSSPRMRGTVEYASDRFIPAHAGNRSYGDTDESVHPRACGEQPLSELPVPAHAGIHHRFIPAHAGNRR